MNASTMKELLDSVFIMSIFAYALTVTGLLILLIGFRPRDRKRVMSFSPGEFLVSVLYRIAATMAAVAEGADSFLNTYREISMDVRFRCRTKENRLIEEDSPSRRTFTGIEK